MEKSFIKKCIDIIRLEAISTKWTPTPEDYITSEFNLYYAADERRKNEFKDIIHFLSFLHHISLDISVKQEINNIAITPSSLIEKFRSLNITPDLVSDETIKNIHHRWKQLIQIRYKIMM